MRRVKRTPNTNSKPPTPNSLRMPTVLAPRPAAANDAGRRWNTGPRWMSIFGAALLALWAVWWAVSLTSPVPHLAPGRADPNGIRATYIPIMPFLGLDFEHNYVAAETWRSGA